MESFHCESFVSWTCAQVLWQSSLCLFTKEDDNDENDGFYGNREGKPPSTVWDFILRPYAVDGEQIITILERLCLKANRFGILSLYPNWFHGCYWKIVVFPTYFRRNTYYQIFIVIISYKVHVQVVYLSLYKSRFMKAPSLQNMFRKYANYLGTSRVSIVNYCGLHTHLIWNYINMVVIFE